MRRKRKKVFVVTKVKPKVVFISPKKFLLKKLLGAIFLILGSSLLTSVIFYLSVIPNYIQKKIKMEEKRLMIIPKKILIPSLNLDMPIEEAVASQSSWILPSKAVAFIPDTFWGEEKEDLVIFGKSEYLANLEKINKGDKIYILGKESYFIYQVENTKVTLPQDESIFAKTGEKKMTLFSTQDYSKGKRFVVIAKQYGNH